jgi:hypothetical protein
MLDLDIKSKVTSGDLLSATSFKIFLFMRIERNPLVETQGKSQRQISEATGVPLATVHAILNRALYSASALIPKLN